MADAVVGAQAAAAEGGRRKTARLGGEIHRVGAYAQHERRRGVPVEWEAGDAKRSRTAGVAQRRDADGARRKADGTLDRRCRANRGGAPPPGGGHGAGDGQGGGGGGGGGGVAPPLPTPHHHSISLIYQ